MYKIGLKKLIGIFLSLIFMGVMVGPASAQVYNLCAGQTTLAMPDGTFVDVWGFGIDVEPPTSTTCASASVPGPVLEVPATEAGLTINLRNTLPEVISLQILGQQLNPLVTGGVPQGPVWTVGLTDVIASTGARTDGDNTARVRSFAHETPAMALDVPGTATYEWSNFRPGTYLLQSGTNPAKQVQMGLYAAVKKDAAAGMAYADDLATAGDESVPYDKEIIMLYSEVDPLMNAAINAGTYGPGGTITSSLHREPKYFLINGKAFNPALADGGGLDPINAADPVNAGETVLIRFLNAGYETHVPQLLNMYMSLVAEDGNPYAYPKIQYGAQMPAGKTIDATIVMPDTIGRFSIHDAVLRLTNNATGDLGGMLAYVSTPLCPGDIEPGDIEPIVPDKDVDGLDLFALTQNTGLVLLAEFADNFGRINCP